MSSIINFLKAVNESEELKNLLLHKENEYFKNKQRSGSEYKNFIKTEIIPEAKKRGFDFTEKDYFNFLSDELLTQLNSEDLEEVSGGKGYRVPSIIIASLSFFGTVSSPSTHAMRNSFGASQVQNVLNQNGKTDLHLAAERGNVESLKRIKGNLVKPYHLAGKFTDEISKPDSEGYTPLHYAAANKDNPDVLEYLLNEIEHDTGLFRSSADAKFFLTQLLNMKTSSQETPLGIAAKNYNMRAVEALIKAGADINNVVGNQNLLKCLRPIKIQGPITGLLRVNNSLGEGQNYPALSEAVEEGYLATIEALAKLGADINQPEYTERRYPPLILAYLAERTDSVQKLEELGVNVNAWIDHGVTPMHCAAECGNVNAIQKLKELGADVNAENEYGDTPMHYAAKFGKVAAIQKLEELGADVNAKDNKGNTPMHCAAEFGTVAAIQKLKDLGANIDEINGNGETPLHVALDCLNLEDLPGNPLVEGNYDSSDLDFFKEQNERVEALIRLGANVNIQNADSTTPLESMRRKYQELVDKRSSIPVVDEILQSWEDLDIGIEE